MKKKGIVLGTVVGALVSICIPHVHHYTFSIMPEGIQAEVWKFKDGREEVHRLGESVSRTFGIMAVRCDGGDYEDGLISVDVAYVPEDEVCASCDFTNLNGEI